MTSYADKYAQSNGVYKTFIEQVLGITDYGTGVSPGLGSGYMLKPGATSWYVRVYRTSAEQCMAAYVTGMAAFVGASTSGKGVCDTISELVCPPPVKPGGGEGESDDTYDQVRSAAANRPRLPPTSLCYPTPPCIKGVP